MFEVFGCAVKHDLAPLLARARPHVYHAISGQHHGRVVLDHHQRVAGIAQAVHGLGYAVHVARVQADRRLVQHKQCVDQRGAERGREVDALYLAARKRAALPVQREVAYADITKVFEPRLDFLKQGLQRFLLRVITHSGDRQTG